MKNHEKSWRISISQLSELSNSVWTCSQLKLCRAPALAPFKTPSASPASTAALRCWPSQTSHLHFSISHWSIIFIDSSLHLCLAKRTVNCAVPGDLPLLLFASLCAVQAPGKHYNDQSCYAISMACLSQSKRQKLKVTIRAIVYGLGLLSELVSLRKCHWKMTHQWAWFLSSNFISGGFPSKTYTGLIPFLQRWYLDQMM